MKRLSHSGKALLRVGLLLVRAQASGAYSVLMHEQVVDLLCEKQLRKAHAYAYGGSLVQDMGYYPSGSRYFSDLTHYLRTGDFVIGPIEESHTANEYAFALGALAYYAADNSGHSMVNHMVAIEVPALQKKYGAW